MRIALRTIAAPEWDQCQVGRSCRNLASTLEGETTHFSTKTPETPAHADRACVDWTVTWLLRLHWRFGAQGYKSSKPDLAQRVTAEYQQREPVASSDCKTAGQRGNRSRGVSLGEGCRWFGDIGKERNRADRQGRPRAGELRRGQWQSGAVGSIVEVLR